MGRVPNVRCPVCQENGHDNGSDSGHMFLMTDEKRWCCNRTDYHPDKSLVLFPNDPETNTPIFQEESRPAEKSSRMGLFLKNGRANTRVQAEPQSFDTGESEPLYCDFRGVPARVWEEYFTSLVMNKETGEPTKQIYTVFKNGKRRADKTRIIEDKDFYFSKGCPKKTDPYGWHLLEGKIPKRLLITEGEVDAASAKYMLERWHVKVISGSHGDKSIKQIAEFQEQLLKVPDLAFSGDPDCPGIEYTEKIVSLFPDIRVLKLPLKDANEMLMHHREEEFVDCYFRAGKYKPPSIVEIDTIKESLRDFLPMGKSYPWDGVTEITYGSVDHQIISIGAGPGAGKSTFIRGLQAHEMLHHREPIGIFSLETNAKITLRQIVGYLMNKKIDIPGTIYDPDEAVAYADKIGGYAYIYDNRFFNGEWENIVKAIRYLYAAYGVKKFYIDPITALVVLNDSSAINEMLGRIMKDLMDLTQELPIYTMLVNHLNNPKSGKAHDEGGRVLPSQFTGSKYQWRFSTDMWGLERDILNEDDRIKNILRFVNLKHRTDGTLTGKSAELVYKKESGRLFDKINRLLETDPAAQKAKEEIDRKAEASMANTPSKLFGRF